MVRKLKYACTIEFDMDSGTGPITHLLYVNSAYDPETAVGGHQPRWFDTLCGATGGASVYNKYTVTDASVKLTLRQGTGPGTILGFGMYGPGASYPATKEDLLERKNFKHTSLSIAGTGPGVATLWDKRSMASVFGKGRRAIMDEAAYSAQYNSNPSNLAYGAIQIITDSATAEVYKVDVELVQTIRFYELNQAAES